MAKLFDLARMTTVTTGTSNITLGNAATVNGVTYLTFAQAGVSDQDVVPYGIADANASEYGYAPYISSSLLLGPRQVRRSTNSNAAINLSGAAQVFITAGSADLVMESLSLHANLGGI